MSYISLRKEILSMTFPPPPAPVYEKNTSLWEKLGYTETVSIASSVPEISSTSTDTEVHAASKILGELGSAVTKAQNELVGFVDSMFHRIFPGVSDDDTIQKNLS